MLLAYCIFMVAAAIIHEVKSVNQFNGGSLSFSLRNESGTFYADLDLITGWVFKKGPCGPTCSESDIGKSTKTSRQAMIIKESDPLYFGNWTSEYRHHGTITNGINDIIAANFTEDVIAFNEIAEWEQEWMKVTVPLQSPPGVNEEDIYFEGHTWHSLNMQNDNLQWHIQGKVKKAARSDTGMPNRSPRVFVKPYYRVKLDKLTHIHIAATDPDGDKVQCFLSDFSEGGQLTARGNRLIGVEVSEDCLLSINASAALGFHDDAWGAVALTIRDYSSDTITVGTETILKYVTALGGTSAQFLIQVLENLVSPEFVKPTADANHHFILYAGSKWKQNIYAKSSENTTIHNFYVIGRQKEVLNKSDINDGDEPRVRYIEITWTPTDTEIGNHLICVTAVDDTGVDSIEDRCFMIEIRPDTFNHSSAIAVVVFSYEDGFHKCTRAISENRGISPTHLILKNRPYFIDMPDFQQAVVCKLDVTCVLPIYVKSAVKVDKIDVSQTFFKVTETGPISLMDHNGESVYEADMSFRDSIDGVKKICLIACDINGAKSDETCIQSKIDPPDPCSSNPCKNSATCEQSKQDLTVYTCHCLSDVFSGKQCEQVKHSCSDGACGPGKCYDLTLGGKSCSCRNTPYTGKECTISIDACTPDPCNQHGVCNNGTCTCFSRYSGDDCNTDTTCPTASDKLECEPTGCNPTTCNGNGVCVSGGSCICSLGYKGDSLCSLGTGNPLLSIQQAGIKFVPPTPSERSSLACYISVNGDKPCVIPLFFATTDSTIPTVAIDLASPKIMKNSTIGSLSPTHLIEGLKNIYTADLIVKGGTEREKSYICVSVHSGGSYSDRRCFEISHIFDPISSTHSMEYKQKDNTYQFIPPTLNGDTNFKCYKNTECHIMLHTNFVSPTCENVVTGDSGVYIMPVTKMGNTCVTEATYTFTTEGKQQICFKSSVKPSSQTRCYYIDVYSVVSDKCYGTPCFNGGDCFHANLTDIYCVCKPGHEGDNCEKGECAPHTHQCDTTSFCNFNGASQQCICPVGKSGPLCRDSPASQHGTTFTDTAVPVRVTCVVNRKCSFPLGISSKDSNPISLLFGYTSPHIRTEGIATESTKGQNTIKATISVIPLEVGTKTVCIQTVANSVNDDEICVEVEVTKDSSSIYGRHDLPHFINPSLPPNAEVRCPVDESCHVLYHITPGDGHEKKCTTVSFTKTGFVHGHIFTSCDNCAEGYDSNTNCSLDVSVVPQTANINQEIEVCVQVEVTESHVLGEERCFKVTVQSKPDFTAKTGCQTIKCHHNSFCDAHVVPPVCYCTPGYSGADCSQVSSGGATGSTEGSFLNTFGLPETITCAVNTTCPISFHMTGPNSPTPELSTGYVDPRLIVGENTNLKKAPGHTGYIGTAYVTPGEPGQQKVCFQTGSSGKVDDEVCITVNVGGTPPPEVEKDKPYFEPPTPLPGTTVLCNKNKMCNLEVQFPGADRFGSSDECPSLEDTSVVNVEGVHIFPPTLSSRRHPSECTSHIGYLSPASSSAGDVNKICIQVAVSGKPGEERCFNIKIEDDIKTKVDAPCRGKTCLNQGKCVADLSVDSPTAECVCQKGYEDSSCSTPSSATSDLAGTKPVTTVTNKTPHFDGHSAIPKEISCYSGEPCNIPIGIKGTLPPVLGYVDPNLKVDKPKMLPSGGGAITTVSTNKTGSYQMCLQTTLDGDENKENIDEVCFEVKVEQGPSPSPDTDKPHFDNGMVPANSTVICNLNDNCHIPVYTKPDTNDKCADVKECPPGIAGVHVFETKRDHNQCVTDFVYHTGPTDETTDICISAGTDGEERNITIESKDVQHFGPCQTVRCKNGGKCVADPSATPPQTAVCACPAGFEGSDCSTPITMTKDLPGITGSPTTAPQTPHIDVTSGIPKEITCVIGDLCNIPIPIIGNKLPVLGTTDPNLLVQKPTLVSPGTAVTQVKPITTSPGTHKICVQTTLDGTDTGENVDEICIDVKVVSALTNPVSSNSNVSQFVKGSVPPESTVKCNTDTSCHIPVYTSPSPSTNKCEDVKECPPGINGVHIFKPELKNGMCVTDAVVKTGSTSSGKSLCLTPGPGGEERKVSIDVQPFTTFGPCQTQHCKHGKCLADPSASSSECVCLKGFEGTNCDNAITPTTHLNGVTPTVITTAQTHSFDGNSGIPTEIECFLNKPCKLPISMQGTGLPVLGYVDPDLTQGAPKAGPGGLAVTKVTPTTPGTKKICFQTTVNGSKNSMNVDEICMDVKVSSGSPASHPQNKPHFSEETLTTNSKMTCDLDKSCHIPIFTEPTTPGNVCEQVTECPPGIKGVHMFETTKDSSGKCVTDAVYKTPTSQTTKTLCISAGPDGEERSVSIDAKPLTSFGPCQKQHCKHGKCLADLSTSSSECVCLKGFEGNDCDNVITPTTHLNGVTSTVTTTAQTPSIDGKSGIPTEIECFLNKPCKLPLSMQGTGLPILGYVSPDLTHGTPQLGPGGAAITEVTPTTTGTQKICFQTTVNGSKNSMNVDEICVDVKVSSGSPTTPPQNKPHFSGETMTTNSKITCDLETSCHIPVYTEPKTPGGECEQVTECSPGIKGVHMFETTKDSSGKCVTDAVYKTSNTPATNTLCISAGPDGEKRTLEIDVKKFNKFGPCQGLHCENGGTCDSGSGTAKCVCPDYVSGHTCHDVSLCISSPCQHNGLCHDKIIAHAPAFECICPKAWDGSGTCYKKINSPHFTLPGVTNEPHFTSTTPRFDGLSGIPTEVICEKDKACSIPLSYFGTKDLLPILGTIDPGLKVSKPVARHGPNENTFGPQTAVISVVPTSDGKVCVQTTLDGKPKGINVDEICIDVKIGGTPPPTNPTKPHFDNTNLPSGSKIICDYGIKCHIPVTTKKPTNGPCPKISQCGTAVPNLFMIDPEVQGDQCVTDVVLNTTPNPAHTEICLVQKPDGAELKYSVDTKDFAGLPSGFGPCQRLHCENEGKCDSSTGTATCICPQYVSGTKCENVSPCRGNTCQHGTCIVKGTGSSATALCACEDGFGGANCDNVHTPAGTLPGVLNPPALTSTTPSFTDNSAIPKEITCYIVQPCHIPFPSYNGSVTTPPHPGHVGTGFIVNGTTSTALTKPGVFIPTLTVIPKPGTSGTEHVCMQTTVDGLADGTNIDEICVDVKIEPTANAPSPPAQPLFTKDNLPQGSTVSCNLDSTCHLPLITKKHNGQCPQVEQCGSSANDAVVIPTPVENADGDCVTDVTYRTDTTPITEPLALCARPGGEKREISIETKKFTDFGPCQKLHCYSGGKCDAYATLTGPSCDCPLNTTGPECYSLFTTTTTQSNILSSMNRGLTPGFGPCQTLHCENEGKCVSPTGTAKCNCPQYVSGTKCEKVSPCRGNTCGQHGTCIVKGTGSSATALCACEDGFEGANCDNVHTPAGTLPGVMNPPALTSTTPSFTDNSAIPKEITCYIVQPCHIPFPSYNGSVTTPPHPGHVGTGFIVNGTTSTALTKPGVFIPTLTVIPKPGTSGPEHVCMQTTVDGLADGTNIDEICVDVKIEPTANAPSPPAQPLFTKDNLPQRSTVSCNLDSTCHLPLITKKHNGQCPQVEQCGSSANDAVVIPTPVENADGDCVTDVTYRTDTTPITEPLALCARPGGEKREISIETKKFTDFGPCQKLHCYSGGKCDAYATLTGPSCDCPLNTTGPECYSLFTTTTTQSNILSSMNRGTCGATVDKQEATGLAKKGLVKCTCMVNGKEVVIIKNNAPPSTENLVKAAAMGAGGMTGTMVIGAVIYIIVNKVKKPRVHPRPT